MRVLRLIVSCLLIGIVLASSTLSTTAQTEVPFSLQVTPSPILATLNPGQPTVIELAIRNTGTQTELLKIEPRSFTASKNATEVTLQDTKPPEISDWLVFSAPTFSVRSGEVFNEKITVNTPKNAGFSYAFALVISRQKELPATGDSKLRGSVAVFTLLNVNRPDATRSFELKSFESQRRVYQYLPATFSVVLKNTGNTIAQPYGTIYIQRSATDTVPIDTLPLNPDGGSVLPGTEREFTVTWDDGFPKYVREPTAANAQDKTSLKWDWSQADNFRAGSYNAKLVAVYNDGKRDVPIEASLSFWVVPWLLLIVGLLIVIILLVGIFSIFRRIFRPRKKQKRTTVTDENDQIQ